jgi:hypothetical protein
LGAEAYQEKIDQVPFPQAFDLFIYYNKMEEWYWRANNRSKAIEAGQKAIEELKNK